MIGIDKPTNLYLTDDGMLVKDDIQYIKDLEAYCEELEKKLRIAHIVMTECATEYENEISKLNEIIDQVEIDLENVEEELQTIDNYIVADVIEAVEELWNNLSKKKGDLDE